MLVQVLWVMSIDEVKGQFKAFEVGLATSEFSHIRITLELKLQFSDHCFISFGLIRQVLNDFVILL